MRTIQETGWDSEASKEILQYSFMHLFLRKLENCAAKRALIEGLDQVGIGREHSLQIKSGYPIVREEPIASKN